MKKSLKLTYLKKSKKFLDKHKDVLSESEVDELIVKFVKNRFYGIEQNIDYKALQGYQENYYRIRKGNIRIIVQVVNDEIIIEAIVEDIGFRGDIYK